MTIAPIFANSPFPARIVFLLQDLKFGGTQRQTLELARRLDRKKFAPELWLLARGDDLAPMAREWEIPLVWLGRRERVTAGSLINLGIRLRARTPEILAPLTVVPNIWGRLIGRWARVPVIVGNCRGGGAPRRQHERHLWRLTDHLLTNSQVLKERLIQDFGVPPGHLTVIPNGVDTEYFRPTAGGPAPKQVILCLARLVADKDPDTLVAAFGLLAPELPEAQLWLVGEGPRRAALEEQLAEAPWRERVRFVAGSADPRPFFREAGVLALSSVTEALPNVVLEAMASGLPVVATAVGGVPELVVAGETGVLVPPREPAALAGALAGVLRHRGRQEAMGAAGRRRVVEQFSPEAMVRRHETVYISLRRRGRPRAA